MPENIYLLYALVTRKITKMIKSFGDKETGKIWNGIRSKKLPGDIQHKARRKLRMINNAQSISDLRIPPAIRLEELSGDRKGFYSIRINQQWRIIFTWQSEHAYQVQILDYH